MSDNNRLSEVAVDFFNTPTAPIKENKTTKAQAKIEKPKSSKVVKTILPKVEKLKIVEIADELDSLFAMGVADLEKKTIHLRPDQIDELEKYLLKFKMKHRSSKPKEIHFLVYLIDFAIKKLEDEKHFS